MTTAAKRPDYRFDPARLRTMKEPFFVRVERTRGMQRMPIDLDPSITRQMGFTVAEGLSPGEGWTRDGILRLESWLVTDWSGGGTYRITIVDGDGERMEWESSYSTQQHPERTPPTLLPQGGGAQVSNSGSAWSTPPPVVQAAPQYAAPYGGYGVTSYQQQPQPQPFPFTTFPARGGNGQQRYDDWGDWRGNSWGGSRTRESTNDRERDRDRERKEAEMEAKHEAERRALQEQVQKLERERMESDYRAQLERDRQQHAEQMAKLQDEMRRLNERGADPAQEALRVEREKFERAQEQQRLDERFNKMQEMIMKIAEANNQRPAGPDPQLEIVKENLRQQKEQFDRLQEQRTADERMRQVQEDHRRREEETRRQIDDMKATMLAAANSKPDPIVTLLPILQGATAQQVEAMKDLSRQQQSSFERMTTFMMAPRDVVSMMRDGSNGVDDLRKNVVGVFQDMFGMQKTILEQAMNLTAGNGPSLGERVLEGGMQRFGDLADRYLSGQRDKAVSEAKAKQAQAEAMAQALAAQTQANAVAQQQQNPQLQQQPQAPQVQPKPPKAPLPRAVRVAKPAAVVDEGGTGEVMTAKPVTSAPSTGEPDQGARVIPLRRLGFTDEEWFGIALPEIKKLRAGVQVLMESLGRDPIRIDEKTGEPMGISAERCAYALLVGAERVQAAGASVKAFELLFAEARFADLTDIVLPDAPQPYRDDVVMAIIEALQKGGDPEVEDPEVEDEDDEESDEYNDQEDEE